MTDLEQLIEVTDCQHCKDHPKRKIGAPRHPIDDRLHWLVWWMEGWWTICGDYRVERNEMSDLELLSDHSRRSRMSEMSVFDYERFQDQLEDATAAWLLAVEKMLHALSDLADGASACRIVSKLLIPIEEQPADTSISEPL